MAKTPTGTSESTHLLISGTITDQGVRFYATEASSRPLAAPAVGTSKYLLKLTTTLGQQVLVPVFPTEVADVPERAFDFFVSVSQVGSISEMALLKDGVPISVTGSATRTSSGQARATAAVRATASGGPAQWSADGDELTFRWDATAEPFVSLAYEAVGGARTVLGRGDKGSIQVKLPEGSKGGTVEASISNGVNARVIRFKDPRQ